MYESCWLIFAVNNLINNITITLQGTISAKACTKAFRVSLG
jgi:hypothetical protein